MAKNETVKIETASGAHLEDGLITRLGRIADGLFLPIVSVIKTVLPPPVNPTGIGMLTSVCADLQAVVLGDLATGQRQYRRHCRWV